MQHYREARMQAYGAVSVQGISALEKEKGEERMYIFIRVCACVCVFVCLDL